MWNSTKAELEENFIALNAKLKREGNQKLSYLSFHLKLEKEQQIKPEENGIKMPTGNDEHHVQ